MRSVSETMESAKEATKRNYKRVETELLAAEGRRSIVNKARVAAAVTRKAAKAGAVAGVMAATVVAARQLRRRRV